MRLASRGAESAPELGINRFVLEHGRMPFLSDPVPPWHYRGWLLFQIQMADNHPGATGRWDHYLRTFEAGHLLDEPIPQVQFAATPSPCRSSAGVVFRLSANSGRARGLLTVPASIDASCC